MTYSKSAWRLTINFWFMEQLKLVSGQISSGVNIMCMCDLTVSMQFFPLTFLWKKCFSSVIQ